MHNIFLLFVRRRTCRVHVHTAQKEIGGGTREGTVGKKKKTDFCNRTTTGITARDNASVSHGGKMGFKIITIILLETNLCDRSDKQTRLLPFIFIFFSPRSGR